jgi:DNA-binding transcriptional LysR family regulator
MGIVSCMDMRRLEYFVAVAEEGNVGRAARRLHMSQPPLSQRIRELEAELGCLLFERTAQGMRLTQAGTVLLAEAHDLLGGIERATERVRRAAGAPVLRVGVLGPGEAALSERVASAFSRSQPGVTVRLRQGDFTDPVVGLASAQVDVAITFGPLDPAGLDIRTVREQPCYAAVRATDPLAARAAMSRADFRREASIRFPPGLDAGWARHWQPAASAAGPVVRSVDECLHAILWEGAQALVPEQVAASHRIAGISYVPVSDMPSAQLVLASRRAARSAVVTAYIDAICPAGEGG